MVLPKGETFSESDGNIDSQYARLAVVTRSLRPKGDALVSDDERTEEHNIAPIVECVTEQGPLCVLFSRSLVGSSGGFKCMLREK